jgi:TP901-1 family phage major tail protein
MTAQKGLSMLLKTGAVSGSPVTVAGLKNTTLSLNNESVDVTNKDSAGYRTLLTQAGTQSITITANGTVESAAGFETFQGYAFANSINTFSFFFGDGDTIEGSFQITKLELAGEYNGAQTFTTTLESSGAWTFTAA